MFHAYLRNKFSIVRLLNRPDKNQDYKVTDFLRKKPKAESTILLSNATNSATCCWTLHICTLFNDFLKLSL